MKYLSNTFLKNLSSEIYDDNELDRLLDEGERLYFDEYNKIKDKLPKELVDVFPILHDAQINNFQIKVNNDSSEISFYVKHNEFVFMMHFINVSNIHCTVPFIVNDIWLDIEILLHNIRQFSAEIIAFGDNRNNIYFEFEDIKIEGENKKLPDGYVCLDDYYNDPKRAK